MEVPAVLFLAIWFIFQNIAPALLAPPQQGGVAYWAHIGGFVVGAAYCWLNRHRLRERPVVTGRPEYARRWEMWDRPR